MFSPRNVGVLRAESRSDDDFWRSDEDLSLLFVGRHGFDCMFVDERRPRLIVFDAPGNLILRNQQAYIDSLKLLCYDSLMKRIWFYEFQSKSSTY